MRAMASLLLAAAGAAALLVVIEGAGGDFGDWPQWRAIAVPVAAVLVPAVLAGVVARRGPSSPAREETASASRNPTRGPHRPWKSSI